MYIYSIFDYILVYLHMYIYNILYEEKHLGIERN